MSYKVKYFPKKVSISYSYEIHKDDLRSAFLDITETADIRNLEYIVHDFSKVTKFEYEIPKDFLKKAKIITQFCSNWNADIKVIAIAKNENIKKIFNKTIENRDVVIWEHFLFCDIQELKEWEKKTLN